MNLELYNNKSLKNVVNKNLSNKTILDFKFKGTYTPNRLEIILHHTGDFNFNYVYIPQCKRYYFINNYEILPNNIYRIDLECDVLTSYRDFIIKYPVLVKFGNIGNEFTNDCDFLNSTTTNIYYSEVVPEMENNIIISTIGG